MKKIFFALFLLIITTTGSIAYLVFPHYGSTKRLQFIPEHFESGLFQMRLYRSFLVLHGQLSEEKLALLYEHIPIIFRSEDICTYSDDPNNPDSKKIVFPGTLLPPNTLFRCKDNVTIKTSENAAMYLTPPFGNFPPHLMVYSGSAEVNFAKTLLYVSTRFATISGVGQSDSNLIIAEYSNDTNSYFCMNGDVKINVLAYRHIKEEPTYFGNQKCNLELTDVTGSITKTLNPGQTVLGAEFNKIENGIVQNGTNPTLDIAKSANLPSSVSNNNPAAGKNPTNIQIQMRAKNAKGDILLFSYTLPMNGPAVCNLKTGATENGPFSDAYQFQAPSKTGTLDLQKGFNSFFLSLQCTDGKNKYISNVIAPKK
jgi:hypothetical protein